MFRLTFKTGNAAFQENGDPALEAARLLRVIADKLDEGYTDGPIMDANGNSVGTWRLR